MNNPDVERFLYKYEAHAELSRSKMYHKRPQYHFHRHDYLDDFARTATYQIETEPYVEMYIPQHQFQRLVQYEEDYRDYVNCTNHAVEMQEQARRDERVRDANPAVQKAWLKYLMLLELARK